MLFQWQRYCMKKKLPRSTYKNNYERIKMQYNLIYHFRSILHVILTKGINYDMQSLIMMQFLFVKNKNFATASF
jgi:hypothetical protein